MPEVNVRDEEREIELEAQRLAARRIELIERHKRFIKWRDQALAARLHGAQVPPPHTLDDYEIRQAVEAGLF